MKLQDPGDRGTRPRGMADERSVDVDEGRDTPDPGGSGPAVAAGVRLSEVQEAYGRYTEHATRCWGCRAIDERCDEGERLHRAYRALAGHAMDQVRDA